MGLVIAPGVADPSTGVSLAGRYVKFNRLELIPPARYAVVEVFIFNSYEDRLNGKAPDDVKRLPFADEDYDEWFGSAPTLGSNPPTSLDGIIRTQGYIAIKTHPMLVDVLAGSVSN